MILHPSDQDIKTEVQSGVCNCTQKAQEVEISILAENLEALRDVVWRILREIGIDHKYLPATQDGMPMPKPGYLTPYFDQPTWDQITQAILEAMGILKAQAIKEAQSNKTIPASR